VGGSRILVYAGVVLCLAVAGCSSNPKPSPLPRADASPIRSVAPSPAAPVLPAAARGSGGRSAKAFVRYYVRIVNHAAATGDTASLAEVSDGSCDSCDRVSGRIDRVYGAGGRISSSGWVIKSLDLVPRQPVRRPVIDLYLILPAQSVVLRAGSAPKRFPGGKVFTTIRLHREGGRWVVNQWDRSA
jgi:hypothetical protein